MASRQDDFRQELLATFRSEAREHLLRIVDRVVALERAAPAVYGEHCETVLKELHALKGAARAVGLHALELLCHNLENVFSALRAGGAALSTDQFDAVHQACQLAEQLVTDPAGGARARAASAGKRLGQIVERIQSAGPDAAPAQAPAPAAGPGLPETSDSVLPDGIRVKTRNLEEIRYQAEALLAIDLRLRQQIAELAALADDAGVHASRLRATAARTRPTFAAEEERPGAAPPEAAGQDAEPGFARRCRQLADALGGTSRSLGMIRERLLAGTMESALAPVSTATMHLAGLVRNLARARAKEAVLEVEGEQVQVDRRVLEVLRDVLIHLVTNAVDHGIEPPARRSAQAKAPAGTIAIRVAQADGSRITVTVADDGAGMDADGLVHAARRSGVLPEAEGAAANDADRLRLALRSGVSTSTEVTHTSGRGVGLAIVAERVASVGGELQIESRPGAGCSFRLILPVSVAALRGLLLRVGRLRYVLPLSDIERVRRVRDGDIERVENRETLLEGGRVIPAIRLAALLQGDAAAAGREAVAVIARHSAGAAALLADEIVAEQEVLPKGLGKQIRRMRYITGAAQLGDASLVPILALNDILAFGLAAGGAPRAAVPPAAARQARRVLVAEDSITSRLLLKHILENAGYQVETATDGLDALAKMRHAAFDVLVTDVEMPGLDGLALTRRLRADAKTADLPIILVTTLSSPEEKQRGLEAGADAYVVKGSFDQDNLIATIARFA